MPDMDLKIRAGVEGGAAAASEITQIADANRDLAQAIDLTSAASAKATQVAEDEAAAKAKLSRALQDAAAQGTSAAAAEAEADLAESLRLQAEAAEAARPAIEALAEAQERLAKLQALQAEGPAGRTVGEMLAINDAIGKQESLIRTLGGEQQQYNTKAQDLVGILNRMNPRLGEVGLGLLRLSRLAGDAGTANLSLGKSIETATQFIKANIATIALLGAGYLAYASIQRAYNVWQKDKEDLAKAADEATRYRQALADLNKERGQQQETIEEIAGQRKGGGFKSADESRAVQQQAERARRKFPQLKESSVNTVAGNIGDSSLSDDEFVRAAFAVQQNKLVFDANKTTKENLAKTRGTLGTNRDQIDRAINLEKEQRAEERAAAAKILASAGRENGPGEGEIKDALRKFLPGSGAEVENLDLLAKVFTKRDEIDHRRSGRSSRSGGVESLDLKGPDDKPFASPDVAAALQYMESIARSVDQFVRKNGGGTTNIAHQTINAADASAQRRREKNGASIFHES